MINLPAAMLIIGFCLGIILMALLWASDCMGSTAD